MFATWTWLAAVLIVPAVVVFYTVIQISGWKRFGLISLSFLMCWLFLYLCVDAGEHLKELRFGNVEDSESHLTAPGHGEARGYAMLGGWIVAGPYIAYLVHLAKVYKTSKSQGNA
ncbi:MAG: hypothetical protein KJ060_16855 [Candidatus Hydrogenedentes bacterium]|nr:hypothetical protein [Candidatus Hydrogenedentota bacterium]